MLTLSSYCLDGGDVHDGYPVVCRFTFHRPAKTLPTTRFTGDTARVLEEVQGDDRLRLHVPRIWQELGHEGLQGELIDARALGVPSIREVLLEEERELPARHRIVEVAERRPGLILAVAHLRVGRGRKDQDRADAERSPRLRAPQEKQGEPGEVTDTCVGGAVLVVDFGDGPLDAGEKREP